MTDTTTITITGLPRCAKVTGLIKLLNEIASEHGRKVVGRVRYNGQQFDLEPQYVPSKVTPIGVRYVFREDGPSAA